LLPAHYWDPLIDQGVEPGTSWEHDLAAPTAAGYRYVEHTATTVTVEAVLDWWDRGSTYETFNDGVRWINPVLGTNEIFGSVDGGPIAFQENGPHVSEVLYRQTEAFTLISDVVGNEADMSLSPISAGFWTGRETDTANPLLNKAPAVTVFIFGEAAADPIVREAVSCMVDVEFLRNNLLQGVARPIDLVGFESASACNGNNESRLSEAVSILADHGWTWDRPPTNPFPQPYEARPLASDEDGRDLAPSTIRSPEPNVDPLSASSAVWISAGANGLGIPTTPVNEAGSRWWDSGLPHPTRSSSEPSSRLSTRRSPGWKSPGLSPPPIHRGRTWPPIMPHRLKGH
jgi:hypothetical protein